MVTTEREPFHPIMLGVAVATMALTCVVISTTQSERGMWLFLAPFAILAWWTTARSETAALSLEGDDLVVSASGGVRRIPRAGIRSAFVTAGRGAPGAAAVRLRRDLGTLTIDAADPDEAHALLHALGFDASQRRTEFDGVRAFHRLMAALLAPIFALVVVMFPWSWANPAPSLHPPVAVAVGLFVVLCVVFWRVMVPVLRTSVGLDGITVGGRLGARFHPWSEVAGVTAGDGCFHLTLRGARRREVWCNPEDDAVLPALVAAAREALAAYRDAAEKAAAVALLDRQGRPVAEWRAAMAGVLRRHGGYRSAALDRGRVEALLADPSTPVERRLGAAMVMAQAGDDDGRTRVRVAAEVVADPGARAALARIADGAESDEAVEAALRERR
ncbi:MAG: hypothetical protein JWM10_2204 [Myxococcaceae bacterium]|nr:hypothetical protein [Myxococcaceae bacterium]